MVVDSRANEGCWTETHVQPAASSNCDGSNFFRFSSPFRNTGVATKTKSSVSRPATEFRYQCDDKLFDFYFEKENVFFGPCIFIDPRENTLKASHSLPSGSDRARSAYPYDHKRVQTFIAGRMDQTNAE